VQALDPIYFSRFERRVAWNAEHSPFRKFSGRFVAFLALPRAIPPLRQEFGDSSNSGYRQVFIRDTCLGAANCTPKTTCISLQPGDGTGSEGKPAGPALSGHANQVAISGGTAVTLFKRSVAVDDRVFLAIANQQP